MNLIDFRKDFINGLGYLYAGGEIDALFARLVNERLNLQPHQWRGAIAFSLNDGDYALLKDDLQRLSTGEPLQYILGYEWFNDLKIGVGPGVLIPRPETGEMAAMAADRLGASKPVILDVCTGSGCIALYLRHRFPSSEVFGTDVSAAALEVAVKNAASTGLEVRFYEQDVLEIGDESPLLGKEADLLISNPPYVLEREMKSLHPNVVEHEPHSALFVPDDDPLLFYKAIAGLGNRVLKPGGMLWFETGKSLTASLADLLCSEGYVAIEVISDLSGSERFVAAGRP